MQKTLLLAALLGLRCLAQEKVFHVATHGNDGWSGRSMAAGKDGPFKTVQRALAAASDQGGSATILLHSGLHTIEKPLQITSAHSGLTLQAAPNERPVLSGGRLLTNWQQDPQNPRLWHTTIPDVRDGRWYFRQLFIDGRRKTRARSPNTGFFRVQGEVPQEKAAKIHFRNSDIRKEWAATGDVEVIALLAWSDIRMQIREVDEANHVATLSGTPRPSNRENNAQYWVENALQFVDSPGEWFLDRKSGRLTYLAGENEDLNRAEVIAPLLDDLLLLKGERNSPVHDVKISGLTFAWTDWTLPDTGYADTQAAVATRGDIRGEFANRITFENCTFTHLAGYGLDLGRGCRNWRVAGNEMLDLGAGGIRIGETARPQNDEEANNSHEITDNHLHELGRVYAPAVGIFIMQSGTNHIAHNHVHDLYYTAVSVGWNWGYQETPCRANIIEFNHLHDIGKGVLSDMGAIYTLGIQEETVIRNNLIHDVNAFTYGGWGLYTDEGSTGILLESNVVYHCKSAGFHQHYGKENVLRNNIFAFNRENQLMRTRPEPHTSFIFTNNIVYFDSGDLLGSNWSNDHYTMDYNLFFDTRSAGQPERMKFAGGTFKEWQGRGHDLHSLIADPLFVNAAQFDFQLRPESPALKLGFKQIDLQNIGVRPTDKRE